MVLFYVGDIDIASQPLLGMVGSRRHSLLANGRIDQLMTQVRQYGIVSGGALGIDGLAHQAALQCMRSTVAVLASGLDSFYPKTNRGLFDQILASNIGVIVSEFPPSIRPQPYYFPQRNRLIASLSSKLVVIEAMQKSGAMITANIAAQIGVDVGAVIGGYNSPHYSGCYDLIFDGACAIGNDQQWQLFLYEGVDLTVNRHVTDLTKIEQLILDNVPFEPIHIDDLASACDMHVNELIEKITVLTLNGHIDMTSGQLICRYA